MENAGDVNSWVFQQGINFKEGQIAALEAQIKAAERDYVQNNFVGPMLPTTLDPISISPSGRSSGSTKKQLDEGTRYIQQLNQRIALLGKETEHEQLLARISQQNPQVQNA
ncbi:hypothetical protein ACFOEY_19790 [Paracandidimonas soli]|uniref:hypothetical protein n=1 Tax=Paracandidimonas soli TaxID=1917182 RepID=UPI00362186EE